jgi:hypothetical protein
VVAQAALGYLGLERASNFSPDDFMADLRVINFRIGRDLDKIDGKRK